MTTTNGNVTPGTDVEIVGAGASNASALDKLAMLSSGSGIVTTIKGDDLASRKATLNAVTSAKSLAESDILGKGEVFNLTNCVFQAVTVTDDNTGDQVDTVRTILLDDKGEAYYAISDGLVGSLRDFFGILGWPDTWPEPLPVQIVEERSRRGRRFMKLILA